MRFRVSRRVGPFRVSAWDGSDLGYHAIAPALEAYQPNWPKRIAIIAASFSPAWIAFGIGWDLLFGVLAVISGVALLLAYGRSEGVHETDGRTFSAWCGATAAGIMLAVFIGMLVQAIVPPASADELQTRENLPKLKEAEWVSAVQNLKTADGSTVIQALQFAEKMRPTKFKFGDMGGAYAGRPIRATGVSIEYWIGAKRLNGDSFSFLFDVKDGLNGPEIDFDRAPAHGAKGAAESLMEGRNALLAMIDEEYRINCVDFNSFEKLC